ncbi:unnamed protein product [Gongylonema pulchrum]|uniref:Glycine zipper 2TM domain-containing protein n=1 Tax=Gongylonema pulchrum TaxID=637853 RepID=A0A183DMY5_9BILA|nr:unnamed protein product [Gongylonema pulchrum]
MADEEELQKVNVGKDEFGGLIGGIAGNLIENQVGGSAGQILGGLIRGGGCAADRSLFPLPLCDLS